MRAIGIDVGGMSIKCGVVDENGQVLDTIIVKHEKGEDGEVVLNRLCDALNTLIAKSNEKISGIGIGLPGFFDTKKGIVVFLANLHSWKGLRICDIISKRTGLPVKITNDANAAALGEKVFGTGKNYSDFVMITLGTGVGSGIVIDNKLFEGYNGQAAELGHFTLVYDGLPCGCGQKGCFEQYASATALMRQTREKMLQYKDSLLWKLCDNDIEKINGKMVFDAEAKNDVCAKEVVNQYVNYLSTGLMTLCNIFRPQIILLSGGVANQGENILKRIRSFLEEHNYGIKGSPKVEVGIASIGYNSGIIGAAALILNEK